MESKKNKQHSTHPGTMALYQPNWNKIQQTFASLFNDLFSLLLQAKKQRTIRWEEGSDALHNQLTHSQDSTAAADARMFVVSVLLRLHVFLSMDDVNVLWWRLNYIFVYFFFGQVKFIFNVLFFSRVFKLEVHIFDSKFGPNNL